MQSVGQQRRVGWVRIYALSLLAIPLMAAAGAIVIGQATDPPDQTSRKVRLRGGEDPNVKNTDAVNIRPAPVAGKPQPPPPARPTCMVHFDNKTTLFTKAFVDGVYAGTVSPLGVLSIPSALGSTVLYARAEYDDGSADAWGPVRIGCKTKYTWRLAD